MVSCHKQGLSIIAARPKSGKSTLACTLTLAVAQGERFLDRHTTTGTVLYLALEEKRAELRRQFKAMGASDEPIQFYCTTAPADGVAQLTDAVMQKRPALVIIDPIIRLSRMVDSNDYAKSRWLWSLSLPWRGSQVPM
jgi:RecA-family ATPase